METRHTAIITAIVSFVLIALSVYFIANPDDLAEAIYGDFYVENIPTILFIGFFLALLGSILGWRAYKALKMNPIIKIIYQFGLSIGAVLTLLFFLYWLWAAVWVPP